MVDIDPGPYWVYAQAGCSSGKTHHSEYAMNRLAGPPLIKPLPIFTNNL